MSFLENGESRHTGIVQLSLLIEWHEWKASAHVLCTLANGFHMTLHLTMVYLGGDIVLPIPETQVEL